MDDNVGYNGFLPGNPRTAVHHAFMPFCNRREFVCTKSVYPASCFRTKSTQLIVILYRQSTVSTVERINFGLYWSRKLSSGGYAGN